MGCVSPLNHLEVSAGPLLHKRGNKRACESEREAEEPDRVDEYYRRGRGEGKLGGWAQSGSTATICGRIGKLLGYLCEEGLDGKGILLQVRVADSNKSSHSGGEYTRLKSESAVSKQDSWRLGRGRSVQRGVSLLLVLAN